MPGSTPADPAPASSAAWQLTDVITRLRRVLRSSVRSDYPWESLPMAQVEILQRLTDEPGIRISEVARRHRLATNTVSTLVQQMTSAGLVERGADAQDRRAVVLTITDAGRSSLAGWRQANETRLEAALAVLTAPDQASIQRALPALGRLVAQLESAEREAPQG